MKEQHEVPSFLLKRYKVDEFLGRGSFGHVYSAIRLRDHLPVAIKCISKVDYFKDNYPLEVCILKKLNHIEGVI